MGWRKETIAIGGVTQPVDVHTGADSARLRLEVGVRPAVGDAFHYEGARFTVETVRDRGGRGEAFEVEAVLAADQADEAETAAAASPQTSRKGRK